MNQKSLIINRLISIVVIITLAILLVVVFQKYFYEKKFRQFTPTVVVHNSDFAFKLYAQLQDQPGNLFFSPYSISTLLAMLYAGARADTATQMAQVLNFPQTPQEQENFYWVFGQLQQRIAKSQQRSVILDTANALWMETTSHFLPPFLEIIKRNYLAELHQVDFNQNIAEIVNAWVKDKTRGRITNLMAPRQINDLTELILANAIYFKGKWTYPFEPKQTKERRFWLNEENYTQVPMMELEDRFYYTKTDTIKILELPYGESVSQFHSRSSVRREAFSMIILLPNKRNGLAELENSLNAKQVDQWLSQMNRPREVQVLLPKFKMTTRLDLGTTLTQMGMPNAFSSEVADFSGLSATPKFISQLLHQAWVEVNEEGTEAAAATVAAMATAAFDIEIQLFHADHPFIFLIRHNPSQSILFLGRLVTPNSMGTMLFPNKNDASIAPPK